ncbi:histidine phosphatase family protein [Akkermansiaceae bacterium]|nr:histidine phosphatase family protein [Akkermansiaceae bacterium]MDA7888438.1 histidine phosphatase family protein [Akkermansiaceae bacterium]MDB4537493.1 histidine phosphatase family protein [Akkermansiaceae bacterium]
MTLYLIRHATADAHGLPGGDFARALIPKGIKQAHRVGNFLRENDLIPDLLLTSPVLRAKETAEILAEEGCPSPVVEAWLSCGMHPEQALKELSAFRELNSVAIVGHEPDFSGLVESLLGASFYSIPVKKASVISLEIDPPRKKGLLNFSIPCKYLPD